MGAGRVVAAALTVAARDGNLPAMSAPAVRSLWCTTCGEYVRPGTHGLHVMSFTAGTGPAREPPPETSNAVAVALVALAITGTGALLIAALAVARYLISPMR